MKSIPADVLDDLLRRRLRHFRFLPHHRSLEGYDDPENLSSQLAQFCLIDADPGHAAGEEIGEIDDLIVDREKVLFAISRRHSYNALEINEDGSKIVLAQGGKKEPRSCLSSNTRKKVTAPRSARFDALSPSCCSALFYLVAMGIAARRCSKLMMIKVESSATAMVAIVLMHREA